MARDPDQIRGELEHMEARLKAAYPDGWTDVRALIHTNLRSRRLALLVGEIKSAIMNYDRDDLNAAIAILSEPKPEVPPPPAVPKKKGRPCKPKA